MKDVAFRDDDLDDEEESTLIATASGDFRSGGIVENIRRSKEITTTAQQTLDPANAMKIAQNSLVDNKPSDLAKLALLQASAVLTAEESSGKRGLKSPSKSTLPTPSFYANATTFKTPSVLFALRLLRAERIILHECAHSPPSSLALSLAKIPRLPAFQSAPVASHFPFIVDEDRLLHKLKIIDENIDVHVNYYNKISATIASQVTIIPSLRLQLWWARQIYAAMESQEAGKAPVGLMVAPSTLEQAPWVTGQIDASFARAWMHSAKFRRANELTELHRLHRFAFLRIQQNRATVEDIEMEIAELQVRNASKRRRQDEEDKAERVAPQPPTALSLSRISSRDCSRRRPLCSHMCGSPAPNSAVTHFWPLLPPLFTRVCGPPLLANPRFSSLVQAVIADTSHAREDFEIKIETLKNRRKKTTNKLNVEIDRRLSLNNNKDARWISKTRQLLPLPYNAIQLDKEWEAERVAEYHELNPHLDKYSTPQMDHQDDFSNPARPYEKPWIEEKPKTPSLFASLDDDNDSQTDSLTSIRTSGSTKNKFACFSVFRGGFSVSRMFSLVHVLRKPPKGYHLGGYIVSCYCTRLGKQTGKLSDLPPIVTAHFMGEVLNDFQESHPALAQRNNPDSDVARWRNWCAHLKLAREILPDGRASGKVKLVHSVQKLPGEICNEVLDEGEQERENVRNPVGIIWKGGMRLRVVSLTHVTHHDDEEEQGNGLNNGDVVEMSAEMRLPPSKCFNFVGNEYFVGTIEGYKGGGYDLPGFNIKLRNVKTGATLANKDPISWTRYKEFGWDRNGKLGVKEVGDLLDFLRNCVVIREAHESHIEFCSVEIADECDLVYKSDDAVIDGKTCIATVRGGFNSGMMGASLEGFGRDGGLFIHAQCVWEGELKDMHAEVSFAALRRSGYKGGWDIRNDDGRLFFGMEHRHVSRLMKNLVFCWEGGDEEDKSNVKLKFIGGRNVIYRGGGYVGGEFCISAFYFESPGVIRVRCIKVKNSEAGELNINELMLVEAGWLQLARNIANSSEAGLKAFLDILHWGGKGELGLKKAGGVVADADVHLTKVILKSAMRVENKIAFVKISTFNYRKEGRGLKGDDGLCFDLTPWGGGGGERERCVLSRDELAEYGVVLMEKCGVGKSLARLPRHTLMMLMGKLRQNATGQKID